MTRATEPDAENVLARVALPFDTVAVFLGSPDGSPATFGVDHSVVSVVCRSSPDVLPDSWIDVPEPPRVPVVRRKLRTSPHEVHYWLVEQVETILKKVSAYAPESALTVTSPDGAAVRWEPLSDSEIELLDRLRKSDVVRGDAWAEDVQRVLAGPSLRRLVTRRAIGAAESALDEAVRRLRQNDLGSGVLAARAAFGLAVDALLANAGEYSPRAYWRTVRFERVTPSALDWDEYWETETMRRYREEDGAQWIMETVARCRELILEVELD